MISLPSVPARDAWEGMAFQFAYTLSPVVGRQQGAWRALRARGGRDFNLERDMQDFLASGLRHLVRIPGVQALWRKLDIGPLELRMRFDIASRPHYAYGVYSSAMLAQRLGIKAISVAEFGVASGNGLLALESLAETIEREVGVRISVFGFDSGAGMPPPVDYRDLPHVWGEGFYKMDSDALRARLRRARLVLGDVAQTIPELLGAREMAPVGFIAFDLDYYSSTKAAFRIFESGPAKHLPRVYCYFDDITGPETACMNEHVGELLAIREFNAEHARQKISKIENLWIERAKPAFWNEKMYAFHDFDHPLYTRNLTPQGTAYRQIPLIG